MYQKFRMMYLWDKADTSQQINAIDTELSQAPRLVRLERQGFKSKKLRGMFIK